MSTLRTQRSNVRYRPILLQKSFCPAGQKFCGPLIRSSCKDAGGLISPR
jgi:hypothetical protein